MDKQIHTEKEFDIFFHEYYPAVLRYCFAIVKDRDEAEDIVQRAFIAIWRAWQSGKKETGTKSYLYRSVHNGSLDFLKHRQVKKIHVKMTLAGGAGNAVTDPAENRELRQQIERAIAQLPDQCRKIFMLSRFESLTYREIAATLSLSEKTVENQMGKALKLLRELLRDHLPLLFTITCLFHD